jgi:two-component system response regulator LytT
VLSYTHAVTATQTAQISALIVDDEKPAREELAYLLKGFGDVRLVGQGKNGLEAVSLIKEHSPDIVFLDVQMPGLDGFGVLRKLVELKLPVPHVIFATAFDNYAVHAFEVNAVDYILKPFDRERVAKAIERARKIIEGRSNPSYRLESLLEQLSSAKPPAPAKLLLKAAGRLLLVSADDIVCASIDEGVISICTRELEGVSNLRTIEDLQGALAADCFWRPHRSHLVNINHIQEVVPWFKSSYMLRMADRRQSEVPVSRTQTRRLRELFKL